jgi:hypothetical protein
LEALRHEQDADDQSVLVTTLMNLAWWLFDDVGSKRDKPCSVRSAALRAFSRRWDDLSARDRNGSDFLTFCDRLWIQEFMRSSK